MADFKDKNLEMQGLNEMGETHLGLKEYDQAIDSQLKAREIAAFLGARSEQWRYELAAGKAYQAKGDLPKAVDAYKKAVETLRGVKSKIADERLLKGFTEQEQSTDVYRRLISLLMKGGRKEEAFSYIEESRSKIDKDAFGDVKPTAVDEDLRQTLLGVDQAEARRDALKTELQEEKKKPEEARDPLKLETLTKTLAADVRNRGDHGEVPRPGPGGGGDRGASRLVEDAARLAYCEGRVLHGGIVCARAKGKFVPMSPEGTAGVIPYLKFETCRRFRTDLDDYREGKR